MNRAKPAPLPKVLGTPANRSATMTDTITDQFNVMDERYLPGDGKTWCNIFTWDWSCAMGAEVPHWVDVVGNPVAPFTPGARELNANALNPWFENAGHARGWREVRSSGSVLAEVNAGNVVVACMTNPKGHGHITPVRPDANEITVINVGARNFARGKIGAAYGSYLKDVRYWVHP